MKLNALEFGFYSNLESLQKVRWRQTVVGDRIQNHFDEINWVNHDRVGKGNTNLVIQTEILHS